MNVGAERWWRHPTNSNPHPPHTPHPPTHTPHAHTPPPCRAAGSAPPRSLTGQPTETCPLAMVGPCSSSCEGQMRCLREDAAATGTC